MAKSFKVPQNVQAAAKRGLELRREHGRGGLDTRQASKEGVGSGVARARDLMGGSVSYETVKRMLAFFNRHKAFKEHHKDKTSAAYISWMVWGGDAGFAWAKRIVAQEEKVEKGSFMSLVLFGEDHPEPEPIEKASSFMDLVKAIRPAVVIDPRQAEKVKADADDFEVDPEDIDPEAPPAGAVAPQEAGLSEKQAQDVAAATSDEEAEASSLAKGVVEIDLNEDYCSPTRDEDFHEADTSPAQEAEPEPELGLELVISSEDHALLKKAIKRFRNMPALDPVAAEINKNIMKGRWDRIDVPTLYAFISQPGEETVSRLNALACGGAVMMALFKKAKPKVPEKYLEGLKGEAREKRKREIQERMAGKHRGKKYDEMPGDKDAKTKPSKYTKTDLAERVREEVKKPGKDEFLRAAAKVSGISRAILEEVYKRGAEAWATGGRRPGASQEAWARARIYSFATGGTTQRTADKDLWERHKKTTR